MKSEYVVGKLEELMRLTDMRYQKIQAISQLREERYELKEEIQNVKEEIIYYINSFQIKL